MNLRGALKPLGFTINRGYHRVGKMRRDDVRVLGELAGHAFTMNEQLQAKGPRIVKPDGLQVIALATFATSKPVSEPVEVTLLPHLSLSEMVLASIREALA